MFTVSDVWSAWLACAELLHSDDLLAYCNYE